ncbi:cyclodeaminase/cyclohydrolase family protein [Gryllotalpicola kribbensis]|uniref:Cyclodeaminase/cyclohydrolase family protein n=1 Tax=Gryllotalpicola kribbensis TaxID=993084 RepID=A0ABP8AZL8_9MICO
MSESLWARPASDLLRSTASADPTPGGGSIAAITGAFGVGLVQMAVAVTGDPALEAPAARLAALRAEIEPAADGDVQDFGALMAAYRLPRTTDDERAARSREVERASIAATERPLALVESFVAVLALSHELEPVVKPGVASDVLAGRDIVVGAARAAVRTADINIDQLDRLGSAAAAGLRARRDAASAAVEEQL